MSFLPTNDCPTCVSCSFNINSIRFQYSLAKFMYFVYLNDEKEIWWIWPIISSHSSRPTIRVYMCICVFRTEPLVFGQSKQTIITGIIMEHEKFKKIFKSRFRIFDT